VLDLMDGQFPNVPNEGQSQLAKLLFPIFTKLTKTFIFIRTYLAEDVQVA